MWARWVFPDTQHFGRPLDFFLAHDAVVVEIASLVEGDFVSLQQYCRGQVHRTVSPTEIIIVANKKDRNVDLPPTFNFKFYQNGWPLPLITGKDIWPFIC